MATASISTIGRAVRDRLPEGKMTWKKMMRVKSDTLIECKALLDWSNVSFSFNKKFLNVHDLKR